MRNKDIQVFIEKNAKLTDEGSTINYYSYTDVQVNMLHILRAGQSLIAMSINYLYTQHIDIHGLLLFCGLGFRKITPSQFDNCG